MSSPTTNRRAISGIMLALVVWGIYLAIGVTGVFVQRSLMDARKSVIVFICVGLFLGLWSLVLWQQRRQPSNVLPPTTETTDDATPARVPWSWPGVASGVFSGLGVAVWVCAALSWRAVPASTTTILGWLAAGLMMGAATAAVVSLSDRARRRGKSFGLVSLLLGLGSLVVFFLRMR